MTQTTNKERAEFEAWLGIKPCGAAHDLAWKAWQAARRAQVVPDGWRLIPEDATEEWLTALREKGVRIGSFESLLTDVLAAAPQPPEAAPVQMPEPEWWINYCAATSKETASRIQESELASAPLYTEHQVRQLLAQHGIKERSA